jgi:hypothetical protein
MLQGHKLFKTLGPSKIDLKDKPKASLRLAFLGVALK